MTAQISDDIEYRDKCYEIAGVNGKGLFDPREHGMEPVATCSACWRGFVCSYRVDGKRLLLDQLHISLNGPAPVLFGARPKSNRSRPLVYQGLRHPIPYTGGLLIARDFIEELYVHMGFHPAWKYHEVHQLVFQEGTLAQQTDRSEQIAALREKMADRPLGPAHLGELRSWIEKCFSQDYDW